MSSKPSFKDGDVFNCDKYGEYVIEKYVNCNEIYIRFLKTNFVLKTNSRAVRRGDVRDRMQRLTFGVGFMDVVGDTKGGITEEYKFWIGMLRRCYDVEARQRYPTYSTSEVSQNFTKYSYFKEWCNNQVGFNERDSDGNTFFLDKDILVKGNKLYSEYTCCFVPVEINNAFVKSNKSRGEYPIGVSLQKNINKYKWSVRRGKDLPAVTGFTLTVEDAFLQYKTEKEKYLKYLADKWKDKVDLRVYEVIMNYEVEITD